VGGWAGGGGGQARDGQQSTGLRLHLGGGGGSNLAGGLVLPVLPADHVVGVCSS
jgi:hypothetical protein